MFVSAAEQYLNPLIAQYTAHANPQRSPDMERYMRHQFPFLGIESPLRRQLTRQFLRQYALPAPADLSDVVAHLWQLPPREYQYAAIDILLHAQKKQPPNEWLTALIESLIVTKSWWDTVDSLHAAVGIQMLRHPHQVEQYTQQWVESSDKWLNRMAIIFQLSYKQQTDAELLFRYIISLSHHPDFFVQKAIGWALRQYSYTQPMMVQQFIAQTPLSPLSVREGLKGIRRSQANNF